MESNIVVLTVSNPNQIIAKQRTRGQEGINDQWKELFL
jgi:hypothetical protein